MELFLVLCTIGWHRLVSIIAAANSYSWDEPFVLVIITHGLVLWCLVMSMNPYRFLWRFAVAGFMSILSTHRQYKIMVPTLPRNPQNTVLRIMVSLCGFVSHLFSHDCSFSFFQQLEKIKAENKKLKEENRALSRVVSKLSK